MLGPSVQGLKADEGYPTARKPEDTRCVQDPKQAKKTEAKKDKGYPMAKKPGETRCVQDPKQAKKPEAKKDEGYPTAKKPEETRYVQDPKQAKKPRSDKRRKKQLRRTRIELVPNAWKAFMLTTTPAPL